MALNELGLSFKKMIFGDKPNAEEASARGIATTRGGLNVRAAIVD